jgi:hypothetical protein
MGKLVECHAGNLSASSNTSLCAERRLLEKISSHALRKGVARAAIAHWISRHFGHWRIERALSDGSHGFSLPCIFCRRALDRMHVRWVAFAESGTPIWWDNAPESLPTRRQMKLLGREKLQN